MKSSRFETMEAIYYLTSKEINPQAGFFAKLIFGA